MPTPRALPIREVVENFDACGHNMLDGLIVIDDIDDAIDSGRFWCPDKIELLLLCRDAGFTIQETAKIVNRTTDAVRRKLRSLFSNGVKISEDLFGEIGSEQMSRLTELILKDDKKNCDPKKWDKRETRHAHWLLSEIGILYQAIKDGKTLSSEMVSLFPSERPRSEKEIDRQRLTLAKSGGVCIFPTMTNARKEQIRQLDKLWVSAEAMMPPTPDHDDHKWQPKTKWTTEEDERLKKWRARRPVPVSYRKIGELLGRSERSVVARWHRRVRPSAKIGSGASAEDFDVDVLYESEAEISAEGVGTSAKDFDVDVLYESEAEDEGGQAPTVTPSA